MLNNKPLQKKSDGPVTGEYIDPLVDFAFKKIFGSEPNVAIAIEMKNDGLLFTRISNSLN